MKPTEFWFWWLPDERTGKLRKTTYRMTAVEAHQRHGPKAKPVEGSCEVRNLAETDEERAAAMPSAWLNK